jgi:hypothetical protein
MGIHLKGTGEEVGRCVWVGGIAEVQESEYVKISGGGFQDGWLL